MKIGNILINDNVTNFEQCEFHLKTNFESKIVDIGDIAIALTGATVGKAGWITKRSLLNQRVLVLKGKPSLLKYISNFIFGKSFYEYAQVIAHGNAQGNLSPDQVKEFQIPLPSLDVQKKIVAEIKALEKKEKKAKGEIEKLQSSVAAIIDKTIGDKKKIGALCGYSNQRIQGMFLTPENYVGVDNLLQETKGKVNSDFVPNSGAVTQYNVGDILLSNIRPYLKKIWFADMNGGASNDVLVLQKTNPEINERYLFYNLKQDKFFDYEMQGIKGVKMPRGDKNQILNYQIPVPSLSEQQKIVCEIEKIENKITALEKELADLPKQKATVLKRYL